MTHREVLDQSEVAVAVFTRICACATTRFWAGRAGEGASHVVPLFVFDYDLLRTWHRSPNRLGFLLESFTDLDRSRAASGARSVVRRGDWVPRGHTGREHVGVRRVHVASDVSGFRSDGSRPANGCGRRTVHVQTHHRHGGGAGRDPSCERRSVPGVHAVLAAVADGALAAAGRRPVRAITRRPARGRHHPAARRADLGSTVAGGDRGGEQPALGCV